MAYSMILPIDDRIGIGILGRRARSDVSDEFRRIGKWSVGGNIGPHMIMPGEHAPSIGPVVRPQFFQPAVLPFQRHRFWPRRRAGFLDRQPNRLAGYRMKLGCSHGDASFFRSALKNWFSSGLPIKPAKPSNLPSRAISVATRTKACMATRASEPPTLMRRTPIAARSLTVKPNAPLLRKLTGFGATAFTTASICSRVLMPGA